MRLTQQLTDDAILRELGSRLACARLRQKLTQQELADAAGVAKRTVERIESGEPTVLTNLIRLLRTLNFIEPLNALLPDSAPSPIEQLNQHKKARKRASAAKKVPKSAGKWTWGDEQ